MRFKKTVYLKRYDEKTHTWSYKELENVLATLKENYNLSDSLDRDAQVILRVMGDGEADVCPQDIISFEKMNEESPRDQKVYTVVAVVNNTSCSKRLRHTRVLCK